MTRLTLRCTVCIAAFLLLVTVSSVLPAGALTITQSDASASVSSPTIANGDPVFIKGIATGHPRNGLQVWLVGYNYLKVSTISVESDNTFTYELKDADTRNLAPGQYFVVVQHPMMNGQFDIVYNPSTGEVSNLQLGTSGTTIYRMSGSGSLQSPAGAQALIRAISSQNIDDTFTTYSFIIGTPSVSIAPVGTLYVGDQFTLSGTTNLAAGDNLQVEITSSSFAPTSKSSEGGFSGSAKTVKVLPGSGGKNTWSMPVDTSSFRPDEYIVKVSGITQSATASSTFQVLQSRPTTNPTPVVVETSAIPSLPSITPSAIPVTTVPPTKKADLPLGAVLAAVILSLVVMGRRKE